MMHDIEIIGGLLIGLIGRKIGMSQVFEKDGRVISVTAIEAGPCPVLQRKTVEKDGYEALQLGFGEKRRANRPLTGHLRKSGASPPRKIVEIRGIDPSDYEVGQTLTVDMFSPGDSVDVTGWSKGRGFTGVVKRHGYSGGPKTHGSMSHDVPGSIGAGTDPGRVLKGKGLPGRMGEERVTVRNLQVVKVDPESNLLLVEGAVPGARRGWLIIRKRG